MKKTYNSNLLDKTLAFIFIIIFIVFAIYFTITELKETQSTFNRQRITFTKKIAHEIFDLIEKNIDVSSKLYNLTAENSVAYAVIQLENGSLFARSEGYALPVGVFEIAEAKALKTDFLILTSFKDTSERLSIVEAAVPIFTNGKKKYILRLGFLKNAEEERVSHIKLKNTLVFALIFIFLLSVRTIGRFDIPDIKYSLLTAMTLIMLILFFSSSYIIRNWHNEAWLDSFVSIKCTELSKMLIPAATKLIENNSVVNLDSSVKILSEDNSLEVISVIKDDKYIYHTNRAKIGTEASGDYYRKSLNTEKPVVYKYDDSANYIALIPVMNGNNRIGTICSIWKNIDQSNSISSLRNKLTMIFVFAYLVLYCLIYIFTNKVEKSVSNESQTKDILINQSKERNSFENKTDEQIVQNTVSLFIYFSGIDEAIRKAGNTAINDSIMDCYKLTKELLPADISHINLSQNGISVLFTDKSEQKSVYSAIAFSKSFVNRLSELKSLPFTPKITIHICKMLLLNEKINNEPLFVGNSFLDYKAIAKVQAGNEIIVSKELYEYLKELYDFEILDILSSESGKLIAYILNATKSSNELINKFESSSEWTKLMILLILKNNKKMDSNKIEELLKNSNLTI